MQGEIAFSQYEVLLSSESIALSYISPCVALEEIEDTVQLPPTDHELLELLAQGNLRALARDPQEVVRSQE